MFLTETISLNQKKVIRSDNPAFVPSDRKASCLNSTMEGYSMLVLSRKAGESVVINDNIVIKIIDVARGRVQLSFDAPEDVSIHRKEVWERIHSNPGETSGRSDSEEQK